MQLSYTVIYEPQPEGGYTVYVPALPGCISEGDTLEEAREMIKDAIRCYCESLLKDDMPLPKDVDVQPIKDKVLVELT
jgi:antitoxin HicB